MARSSVGPRGAPRESSAAYKVVAHELRTAILRGRYRNGAKLPTEAELAEQYDVSRQTIRRAFVDLVAEGMVIRIPGRGTFAAEDDDRYLRQFGSVDDLMNLSVDTEMQVRSPLGRRVDLDAAGRLQLENDSVATLSFVRLHDDVPFCFTSVYLPPAIAGHLDAIPELERGARSSLTIIAILDERMPAPIAEAEQSITVALASAEVASALACEPGAPLLRIDRIYFNLDGEAVELAISHFLPEHYSYRVRLKRSVR